MVSYSFIRFGIISLVVLSSVSAKHHHGGGGGGGGSDKPHHNDDRDFDFFYFVQQWPGAYCDSKGKECCYPKMGKPASDFGIHGLWPNYDDGSYPSNCDSSNSFDESQIEELGSRLEKDWATLACPSGDGLKFWSHEWNKHGTCAESTFSAQRDYFQAALDLKDQTNLLGALKSQGMEANDEFYNLEDIKQAIKKGTGFEAWVECNIDEEGNSQIYQVYMCVDKSGKKLIKCPVIPRGNCPSRVQFPKF
ncbi:hypothetical protein V2J09_019979 [Rumex salicifolius]